MPAHPDHLRAALMVLFDDGAQPGEIRNAVGIVKKLTGKDRDQLVKLIANPSSPAGPLGLGNYDAGLRGQGQTWHEAALFYSQEARKLRYTLEAAERVTKGLEIEKAELEKKLEELESKKSVLFRLIDTVGENWWLYTVVLFALWKCS